MSTALISSRGAQHPRRWTPAQLGTLSLWLDADDPTTITIATGVSQWDDKSGNGRNVTQGIGANQPEWVVGARNGRAVLRFDGVDKALTGGDVLDIGTGGLSIAAVISSASNGDMIGKINASAQPAGGWMLRRNQFYVNTLGGGMTITAASGFQIVGGVVDRQASATPYQNGTAGTAVTTGFPNTNNYGGTEEVIIGGRASATAPTNDYNGDIAEIVFSLATWSTDDRQKVEGYLAHKWGTTASLPSGHPYKDAAP